MQVPVYKELSGFQPKIVGPFTLRQFCAVVACVPICYGIVMYLRPLVGMDLTAFALAIPAVIAYLFGWTRPYGMTIEKFAVMYVKTRLLPPNKRKFVIENTVVNSVEDANAAWARSHQPKPNKAARKSRGCRKKLPDGAIL